MSTDQRPVAFISHHSSQAGVARHLVSVLARHGIRGWMAPDDIEAGRPFDEVIIEQIRASDVILLLFCARSDQSKHVKREIMLAEDTGKLIYPIRLEAIQPAGLAYWLQDYQWTDWLDKRDATIDRMVAAIKKRIAPDPMPESGSEPELSVASTALPSEPPTQINGVALPRAEQQMLHAPPNATVMFGVVGAVALLLLLFLGLALSSGSSDSSETADAAAGTMADPFQGGASARQAVDNVANSADPASTAAGMASGPDSAISNEEFERRKAQIEALSRQQQDLSRQLESDDAKAREAIDQIKM